MVGIAQLVSAPDCGSGGRGFESHYPPFCGSLAQLVEHWTFNPGVPGSNPGGLIAKGMVEKPFLFSVPSD